MRPDYCPMANEPCQSMCDTPCSAHRLKIATVSPQPTPELVQAAKQALEALEQLDGIDTETECVTIDVGDVITALRSALDGDTELNLNCKSVQKRLAAQWGFVPALDGDAVIKQPSEKFIEGLKRHGIEAIAKEMLWMQQRIDVLEQRSDGEAVEPVAYWHQCRKKPELVELSMKKRRPDLSAKGYEARPLIFGDTAPHPSQKV